MRATAAVVPSKNSAFELRDVEIDDPRADEVLIRVVASGICHTDLIVRDQWYPPELPAVLGHEGSGIVERVGADVTAFRRGDRVAMSFNFCRSCRKCLAGRPAYCENFLPSNFGGRRADGSTTIRGADGTELNANFFGQSSFGTYALAPEHTVVKVPDDVPLALVGPLGCGIQTGAGGVFNSLRPAAGDSIAVFGAGAVGLSAIMAARVSGCSKIIAVDLQPGRLELAMELGATKAVNGANESLVQEIIEATGGGVDHSIESTGNPRVFRSAVEVLNHGGTCGLIGAAALGTEVALDMSQLLFDRRIHGICEGDSVPRNFIPRLIELYRGGLFPFDRLIRTYPFQQINQAAEDSERGATVKPVIMM